MSFYNKTIVLIKKAARVPYYWFFEGKEVQFSAPAELRGKKWIQSRRAGYSYASGSYEQDFQGLIRANVNIELGFWDVGAHVGFFSLFSLGIIDSKAMVVSFEPHPLNYEYINRIYKINGMDKRWVVKNIALSSKEEEASFDEGPTSSTGSISSGGRLKVNCRRADDVWHEMGCPSVGLMKVDVEGSAGSVLEGARELVSLLRPKLLIEIHSMIEAEAVYAALPKNYGVTLPGDLLVDSDNSRVWPYHVLVSSL